MSDKVNILVNLAMAVDNDSDITEHWDNMMDFVFAEFAEPDPDSVEQIIQYLTLGNRFDDLHRAATSIDERLVPILVARFMMTDKNCFLFGQKSRMMGQFFERYSPIIIEAKNRADG